MYAILYFLNFLLKHFPTKINIDPYQNHSQWLQNSPFCGCIIIYLTGLLLLQTVMDPCWLFIQNSLKYFSNSCLIVIQKTMPSPHSTGTVGRSCCTSSCRAAPISPFHPPAHIHFTPIVVVPSPQLVQSIRLISLWLLLGMTEQMFPFSFSWMKEQVALGDVGNRFTITKGNRLKMSCTVGFPWLKTIVSSLLSSFFFFSVVSTRG